MLLVETPAHWPTLKALLSAGRIAGPQEVGVQRVHALVVVDGAAGGHQGLSGDLPAEHPLAVLVGAQPSEDVDLDGLEVEQLHQGVERSPHYFSDVSQSATGWRPCSAS